MQKLRVKCINLTIYVKALNRCVVKDPSYSADEMGLSQIDMFVYTFCDLPATRPLTERRYSVTAQLLLLLSALSADGMAL